MEGPHRRHNPLSGEWVLVSAHRLHRPWQGDVQPPDETPLPERDPNCYLCPGSRRANGIMNPNYTSTFVFENDFAAILPAGLGPRPKIMPDDPLFSSVEVQGECRVICFSPRHNQTLAEMPKGQIRAVIDLWCEQTEELGGRYKWVQIFENKGKIMGSSNPHPHGQIWASDFLPTEAVKEDTQQRQYYIRSESRLLMDYLAREKDEQTRVVLENPHWTVVVPYWAVWPYETLLLPNSPISTLPELDDERRKDLADILKRMLLKYDHLFNVSFPYCMGWHGAPGINGATDHWQLHAHFYPPLLRSASIRKFMVGYEMLGEPQRDWTAEEAAESLRSVDS